jgi:hypothetical protein
MKKRSNSTWEIGLLEWIQSFAYSFDSLYNDFFSNQSIRLMLFKPFYLAVFIIFNPLISN